MRRQRAKPSPGYSLPVKTTQSTPEPSSHVKASNLIPSMHSMRLRANSADIAEERSSLTYPTANKSEGKILRPQYKDILKGMFNFMHIAILF